SKEGDKPSTVVVHYPDGSKEEVPVTVHVTDDSAKYEPKGQDVDTDLNVTPKAEDSITNKDDMPEGTKYEWKETPDVSTPGKKPSTVVITYPDGTQDEVPVTVNVIDDATKYEPKGNDIDTDLNKTPNAEDGITNKDDMPKGTTYEWKDTPDVSTPGDKPSVVVVTYPDGSKDEVPVTVHVTDDASKHEPKGNDIDTDLNKTPNAEDGITNKDDMPKGTTYEWKDTPDVSTPGDKPSTVVVTYPDGSKEEVNVTVHVDDDASKHEPKGNDIDTDLNETPKAEDGITN
ncbi:Rib/alpha-like domain-containing protein, partial [Ligilactobacillus hayakitensis]|uniref:Rib/alpha-like domain-containing protein n=1 Tax=Ligilactobacillus hayakitensis TaxID=396716 RepID=UPI002287079F